MTSVSVRPRRRLQPPNRVLGSETPRVWTPPLRELTEETSLGFECARFAEDTLGLRLRPWQRWFLVHALELHPTEVDEFGESVFRFRKVIMLVGRQNGKSTVMQALTLWRLFVDRCGLVIGTAQDLEVAESLWAESLDMALDVEELRDEIEQGGKIERQPGRKMFRLRSRETYKVKAASRRGGRGLSGELVLLDELREHQSWDAWAAVTKTTNAKARAQIYGISNAGDASSIVLRYLRKTAHAELGDPDGLNEDTAPDDLVDESLVDDEVDIDSGLGIFEWSAPVGAELTDPVALAQSNPSLGYGGMRLSTLLGDAKTDPEWVYRTEVMCQWSEGTLEGLYPPGAWEGSADESSARGPDQPIVLCVDVSWDRSHSHVGLATFRADGDVHVELIASRAGIDWVVPWLDDPARSDVVREAPVVVQAGRTPAAPLISPLTDAGRKVIEWSGADLTGGFSLFYDLVRAAVGEGSGKRRVWHRNQTPLNLAVATAVSKPAGDAWVIDRRKSAADVAPLIAVNGAVWALLAGLAKPKRSKYEDRDLLTV